MLTSKALLTDAGYPRYRTSMRIDGVATSSKRWLASFMAAFCLASAAVAAPSSLVLTASRGDPLMDDFADSPASRSLSMPAAERKREESLQTLEDERLERCRSTDAFTFDQCFFFGDSGAMDARRAMEGAGSLSVRGAAAVSGAAKASGPTLRVDHQQQRSRIPTW